MENLGSLLSQLKGWPLLLLLIMVALVVYLVIDECVWLLWGVNLHDGLDMWKKRQGRPK